ncbi:guanylate kinase [Candidatus Liberibacter solanacearum]|uniref:Guanylate kinase n=1 Tax=Candidatus Liberibacter solanacearum TaxID=556287 RepID=A0A424FNS3_9HYPH|nr:guanylate kinase [Candidatus Liberibacter solanacearum]RPD37810.1 guanylate kinase [Candidatus Liberibacter solanacearum]
MSHIFVIIGASGVGKTTLARAVVRCSEQLIMPVGVTTRKPRVSERQGIDYRFIAHKTFQQWQQENLFVETATYRNEQYGILKQDIIEPMNKGFDILTILTSEGLDVFNNLFGKKITSLFITPPSIKELKRRRHQRDNWKALTQEDDIFGIKRAYDFKIINDNLEQAVEQIRLVREIVKQGKIR